MKQQTEAGKVSHKTFVEFGEFLSLRSAIWRKEGLSPFTVQLNVARELEAHGCSCCWEVAVQVILQGEQNYP